MSGVCGQTCIMLVKLIYFSQKLLSMSRPSTCPGDTLISDQSYETSADSLTIWEEPEWKKKPFKVHQREGVPSGWSRKIRFKSSVAIIARKLKRNDSIFDLKSFQIKIKASGGEKSHFWINYRLKSNDYGVLFNFIKKLCIFSAKEKK